MKSKPIKPKRQRPLRSTVLLAGIDEERILQLSNDLSENIKSGTVKEWRSVAYYFRHKLDQAHNDINSIRPSVAAMVTGMRCVQFSHQEMDQWLKRVHS
jgi:hypothetical protein